LETAAIVIVYNGEALPPPAYRLRLRKICDLAHVYRFQPYTKHSSVFVGEEENLEKFVQLIENLKLSCTILKPCD